MKHKKLKVVLAIIAVLLIVSVIGNNGDNSKPAAGTSTPPAPTESNGPTSDPVASVPENSAVSSPVENPLMAVEFKTADVLNGFGTEKIGEYGYIKISKTDMETVTSNQLTEFCQSKCDGSGLNWVCIMFEDGTGLQINPGSWFVSILYGTFDAQTAEFSDDVGAIMPETWLEDGSTPVSYKYVSFEELREIQGAVENAIDSAYSGFYSCTVDFMEDGSSYSVSLLIDDADSIETLETLIDSLNDSRISDIQITAMQDGKIIATN